jgi:hypothetical protein
MPVSISGTNGVTFPDNSLQAAAASPFGLKNRIINGDMVIDQRNAGASGTAIGGYTVDRWAYIASTSSKLTWQQNAGSVTPPAGFTNYLGVTSSSAYSVPAGEVYVLQQPIEGFNIADLAWGTANAQTVTLSFWARSSLTGTFGGVLINNASNRSYPFTYTISSANTWEKETITIAGDTTGTWLTNNGCGILLRFSLGSGSTFSGTAGSWSANNFYSATGATSVVGTNGATFYITGVQLERNTTATPFEWIPYGLELALCQRYFEKSFAVNTAPVTNLGAGTGESFLTCNPTVGNGYSTNIFFRVTKRTTPTSVILYNRSVASNTFMWYTSGGSTANGGIIEALGENSFALQYPGGTTYTITTGHWTASAEL